MWRKVYFEIWESSCYSVQETWKNGELQLRIQFDSFWQNLRVWYVQLINGNGNAQVHDQFNLLIAYIASFFQYLVSSDLQQNSFEIIKIQK